MTESYEVTIYVEVNDEAELYEAARARCIDDGVDDEDIPGLIGTPEEPDVANCLRFLADPGVSWPGTSIQDSSASKGEL